MILNSILIFIFKKLLYKTRFFSKELVAELRTQIKEQQEYIDYQSRKIIELQNMILKGRDI